MMKKDAHTKGEHEKKPEKSNCLECIHCCTGHVASLSSISVKLLPVQAALDAPLLQVLKSDLLFSLLRPPKSFV
jgi:hypothetical protein